MRLRRQFLACGEWWSPSSSQYRWQGSGGSPLVPRGSTPATPPRGFTLVEMLVVIAIIGILAAILVPVVGSVIANGKLNAMGMEVTTLGQALEAYKLENKDYPPDFSNTAAVVNHMRRAYPRNTLNVAAWLTTVPQDPNVPDPTRLDPAEALVFWLSELKANQRNPILGGGEKKVYFEFKENQLTDVDLDGWKEYASEHAQGVPYVYFDGRITNDLEDLNNGRCRATRNASVCAYAWAVYPPPANRLACVGRGNNNIPTLAQLDPSLAADFGVVRPYRSNTSIFDDQGRPTNTETFPQQPPADVPSNSTAWIDPGKFQIIAPGLDRSFGIDHETASAGIVFKAFPQPNYYSGDSVHGGDFSADRDNLTSFTENQTIEAAIP